MTDQRDQWLDQCEDYYRDRYPRSMRAKVREALPTDGRRLKVLMDIVIAEEDAWKRSVKVPDVAAVKRAKTQMYQQYPEFQDTAIDADRYLLEELPDENGAKRFMAALLKGLKTGKTPEQVYEEWTMEGV